jgi:hypothetical protein
VEEREIIEVGDYVECIDSVDVSHLVEGEIYEVVKTTLYTYAERYGYRRGVYLKENGRCFVVNRFKKLKPIAYFGV